MTQFQHGHAVIIGVGADLPMTVRDAAGVAEVLRDPDRCAYPEEQVELLTEGEATKGGILDALDRLARRCANDPEATAVIYYSGHGGRRQDDGTYFLVPYGFSWDTFAETAITGIAFAEKIEAVHAQRLLVILDCCHAGGLTRVKGVGGQTPVPIVKEPLPPEVIQMLHRGSGRAALASCKPEEVSLAGEPYSVFTAALLEALAGYGSRGKNGLVELADVTWWLGEQVPRRAERTGRAQNPILDYAQVTAKFPLAYYAGGEKQVKRWDWSQASPAFDGQSLHGAEALGENELVERDLIDTLADMLESHFALVVARLPGLRRGDLLGSQTEKATQIVQWAEVNDRLPQLRDAIFKVSPRARKKKRVP